MSSQTKASADRFARDGGDVAIRRVHVPKSLMSAHVTHAPVSAAMRARQINVRFPGTEGTVQDLIESLSSTGDVQVAFAWSDHVPAANGGAIGGAAGAPGTPPAGLVGGSVPAPLAGGAQANKPGGQVAQNGQTPTNVSEEILKRRLPFTQYDGTLGGLLDTLRTGIGLVFWQDGKTLFISDKNRFSVSLPQNEDVIKSVADSLKSFGASDIVTSVDAGKIIYSATPTAEDEIIEPFLKRTTRNLATIELQVAIVTLALTDNTGQGFDWAKFGAVIDGRSSGLAAARSTNAPTLNTPSGSTSTSSTSSTTSSTSSTGTTTPVATGMLPALTLDQLGPVADMTSSGLVLGGTGIGKAFGVAAVGSITSAIAFLSTFGNTNVTQNVELRTLSGRVVKIRSGDELPYVKTIGVSQSSGSSGNSGSTLGTAETQTVKTGLTVEMTPRFDSDAELITSDVKLELKSLVEMVQLSAGNQLGTLTQPHTADQEFSDIVRMRAGQTVVIGGLQYDSEQSNGNEPTFLRDQLGSAGMATGLRSQTVSRNALFVILRPIVTVYETE